jgi:hypothetical protein
MTAAFWVLLILSDGPPRPLAVLPSRADCEKVGQLVAQDWDVFVQCAEVPTGHPA